MEATDHRTRLEMLATDFPSGSMDDLMERLGVTDGYVQTARKKAGMFTLGELMLLAMLLVVGAVVPSVSMVTAWEYNTFLFQGLGDWFYNLGLEGLITLSIVVAAGGGALLPGVALFFIRLLRNHRKNKAERSIRASLKKWPTEKKKEVILKHLNTIINDEKEQRIGEGSPTGRELKRLVGLDEKLTIDHGIAAVSLEHAKGTDETERRRRILKEIARRRDVVRRAKEKLEVARAAAEAEYQCCRDVVTALDTSFAERVLTEEYIGREFDAQAINTRVAELIADLNESYSRFSARLADAANVLQEGKKAYNEVTAGDEVLPELVLLPQAGEAEDVSVVPRPQYHARARS